MSIDELLAMSEEEKLAYLESQQTEVKLCSILEPNCTSCE